jgi:hypothetical protein
MFEAPSGVRMERAAKQGEKGVLLIEEKTIFPADVTQADKDEINSREYELASEDGRIVQRLGGAELVLLDLDAESWTVPVKGGGEGPDVMSCRVEEQGEGQVLERRRGLVNVLCAYDGEPYLAYSMAEELGMVSFSILRDGKVVDSMRLAGRKSAGGD